MNKRGDASSYVSGSGVPNQGACCVLGVSIWMAAFLARIGAWREDRKRLPTCLVAFVALIFIRQAPPPNARKVVERVSAWHGMTVFISFRPPEKDCERPSDDLRQHNAAFATQDARTATLDYA